MSTETANTNGWSRDARYVNTTLDDLKGDVMRLEGKVDRLSLEFAYNKGRMKTMTGFISAAVSAIVTIAGIWLERILIK